MEAGTARAAAADNCASRCINAALSTARDPIFARKCMAWAWYVRWNPMWSYSPVYCAFAEECGWQGDWSGLKTISTRSGIMYWLRDTVVVCDRPCVMELDEQRRPHAESGPWLRYTDGQEDWAIGGVRVPKAVVMAPDLQTIEVINGEQNEEVRRVRIERFGWVRYLRESGATIVHKRRNEIDQHQECLVRDSRGVQRLIVSDPSTSRMYALGVPRTAKTCEAAPPFLNHGHRITHRS